MPNLFDYLDFRGDIPCNKSGLNEVDALAFSKLISLDLSGIVPLLNERKYITLKEAYNRFVSMGRDVSTKPGALTTPYLVPFFENIANQPRFMNIRLSNYADIIDEENEMQFAAMTIDTRRRLRYIVFRGTDDTLTGWKENFNMSFMETVPSQIQAADYLSKAAASFKGRFVVAGHSKGGNLSVYACAAVDEILTNRITQIYNFDGPGFLPHMLEKEGYKKIAHKICKIVPQDSIIGMLLEQKEDYQVVKSRKEGYLQHDCFMWQIKKDKLVRTDKISAKSANLDKTLSKLMNEMPIEARKDIINTFFNILYETGAHTLSQLSENKLDIAMKTISAIRHMDEKSVAVMKHAVGLFIKESQSNKKIIKRETKRRRLRKKTGYSQTD